MCIRDSPMTNDPVNFVRQGALIASAMILIQHTEQTCPKVRLFYVPHLERNKSHYSKILDNLFSVSFGMTNFTNEL